MHIGTKIKELRKTKDMTQEKLAEYLNVSFQAVSKWETNANDPGANVIMQLSKILGINNLYEEYFGEKLKSRNTAHIRAQKLCSGDKIFCNVQIHNCTSLYIVLCSCIF